MTLVRKHFQITPSQLELIKKEIAKRSTESHPWSESDVIREALDQYFVSKNERKK